MAVELKVPQAGESVQEVQIGEWRKGDGDYVRQDEILVEIETDKAAMELPAPASGLLSIRKQKGEIVKVGEVLASVDDSAAKPQGEQGGTAKPAQMKAESAASSGANASQSKGEPVVMPAARRAMAQSGVSMEDVKPTGPGGRILKEDVMRGRTGEGRQGGGAKPEALGSRDEEKDMVSPAAASGPRHEETVPMSMLRRRVAQRLLEAQQNAAMLTTFNEADMSAVMQLRKDYIDSFEKKYGIKLGFMSFFVKAAIDALKLYPQINAEIRGNDIIYKNYFDVGVAVSSERGLVVPVLRNAELMSFAQVEQSIAELARRARDNKLALEDLEGGTFTITNGGIFGSLLSTPILNPPQSGILGLHAIQDRAVVREGQIVVRPMMYVALTYDHRIVDGREAVTFLRRIKECIENPSRMLLEV